MADKTAVIYCRVSTARQAEDELPIASQRQRCEERATQLGAEVLRVFADEGISGQHDGRPAFQAAILFCEAHTPTYFITWSTSRFARNRLDAQLYKRRLSKTGTELLFVSMDIDRSSDGGWLTEGVMELFDEFYSRQISADTRRSMMRAAQGGFWAGGCPPFGYRAAPAPEEPRRRRLEGVAEEAATVKRIFQQRAQGQGARAIAVALNADGLMNRQHRWHKSSVLALLRNRAMIGQIVFGRRLRLDGVRRTMPDADCVIVEAHPPLIDRALWETVQRLLDRDALNTTPGEYAVGGSPISRHFFTGLLKCGRCGAALLIETAKGRSKRYSYYNCRTAQQGGACVTRRLPAREMDDWLVDLLCEDLFTPQNLRGLVSDLQELAGRWHEERQARRLAVEAQRQAVARRNAKLYEVLEELGREAPHLGDLAARLRENNGQLKKFESELVRIDAEQPPQVELFDIDAKSLMDALVTTIKSDYNPSKARALFASFIKDITVEADSIRIEYDPNRLVKQAVPRSLSWLPKPDCLGTVTLVRPLPDRLRKRARR
jgi:DNA invertase Pin-like site-specific DNA recombinase